MWSSVFGCKPKHPSIKNLLTDIIENTENIPDSPLLHTGPEKINSIFVKDKTLFDNTIPKLVYYTESIESF